MASDTTPDTSTETAPADGQTSVAQSSPANPSAPVPHAPASGLETKAPASSAATAAVGQAPPPPAKGKKGAPPPPAATNPPAPAPKAPELTDAQKQATRLKQDVPLRLHVAATLLGGLGGNILDRAALHRTNAKSALSLADALIDEACLTVAG